MRAGARRSRRATSSPQQGEELFRSLGCSGCHAPIERARARLAGLYGRAVHLSRRPHRDGRRRLYPRFHFAAEARCRRRLPADHAELSRAARRRPIIRLIAYIKSLPTTVRAQARRTPNDRRHTRRLPPAEAGGESYLNDGHTLASWLTTTDHKRIAILYALAITVFFFIGGGAIGVVRLELLSPRAAADRR